MVNKLKGIDVDVIAKRLCKALLSRYVLLEPASVHTMLPCLLTPKGTYQVFIPFLEVRKALRAKPH